MNTFNAEALDAIRATASLDNLKRFLKTFWHIVEPSVPYQDGMHIDAICDHLKHIKQIRNLVVCMPPRHTKSLLVSVMFFCQQWAIDPSLRFLYASYAQSLSQRDSIKCRNLINSPLYQKYYGHKFKWADDENTKLFFANDRSGFRLATSIEGASTGHGGDFLIVDDANNVAEADSKAKRDAVNGWYRTAFANRLNDPKTGCRIIVMQRCHAEDLAGMIMTNDTAKDWTKLILPLEYRVSKSVPTKLGWHDSRTKEGELLSDRIDAKEADFLRHNLGKRAFGAQYNQDPESDTAGIFKESDLRYYDKEQIIPDSFRITAVDLAISQKTGADYTAIITADCTYDGQIFVKEIIRKHIPSLNLIPTLEIVNKNFNPDRMLIEDVGFQRLIIDEARAKGLPAVPVKATADKVSRSVPLQLYIEGNKFHLPLKETISDDFKDELTSFPGGPHDDMVDAASMIAAEARKRTRYHTPDAPKEEPKKLTPEEEEREANERYKTLMMWGLQTNRK